MLPLDSFILLLAIQFSPLTFFLQVLTMRNLKKCFQHGLSIYSAMESPEAREFTTVNSEQLFSDPSLTQVHSIQGWRSIALTLGG